MKGKTSHMRNARHPEANGQVWYTGSVKPPHAIERISKAASCNHRSTATLHEERDVEESGSKPTAADSPFGAGRPKRAGAIHPNEQLVEATSSWEATRASPAVTTESLCTARHRFGRSRQGPGGWQSTRKRRVRRSRKQPKHGPITKRSLQTSVAPPPGGKAATSCPDVLPREGLASNNLDMNLHQASTRQDDQTSRNDIGRQLHHQCMDARQPAQSEYRASGSDAVQDNDDIRRRAQSTASNTAQQE